MNVNPTIVETEKYTDETLHDNKEEESGNEDSFLVHVWSSFFHDLPKYPKESP